MTQEPKRVQWTSTVEGETTKYYRFFVSFLGDNMVDPYTRFEVYTEEDAQLAEDTINRLLECARAGLDIRVNPGDTENPSLYMWVETPEGMQDLVSIELWKHQDASEVADALRKELEAEKP